MALRAGYKGFKKLISPLILNRPGTIEIDGDALNAEINKVFFPRSEQTMLGVKNLLPSFSGTYTNAEVTYTADSNGVVTCSGTASGASFWRQSFGSLTLKKGTYKIYGGPDIPTRAGSDVFVALWDGSNYIGPDSGTNDKYTFAQDTIVQFTIRIGNGIDSSLYTFYPMIYLASDPDSIYVPYAMTNNELTVSAADQKTAINAIIAAATGAADFAAFKAAMGAITPVTRSLAAPAELTIEEPVTEKKTTRKKSTAAAETEKEGE